MNKNNVKGGLTLHLYDTSKRKDSALHRHLRQWIPLIQAELFAFMLSSRGLKFKKNKLATVDMVLTLCGETRIKTLNREFRGKDKVTDVLSFPLYQSLRPENCDLLFSPHIELGDVVICLPVAHRQAKQFSVSLIEEIAHQLVHGFLHLVGYDHELSAKEEELMEKIEAELVANIYRQRRLR